MVSPVLCPLSHRYRSLYSESVSDTEQRKAHKFIKVVEMQRRLMRAKQVEEEEMAAKYVSDLMMAAEKAEEGAAPSPKITPVQEALRTEGPLSSTIESTLDASKVRTLHF